MRTESTKLREVKAILRNEQRIRTEARVLHYKVIEEAFRLSQTNVEVPHRSSSSSVQATSSSTVSGNWTAVRLGTDSKVWSRQLLSGDREWFTATVTTTGEWELNHSTD